VQTTTPEHDLHRRYAHSRDAALREQLVNRYLPLARYAASRYARAGEPFDDLLQVASVGLLKAIDGYDPERLVAFSSFALPTMTGELRRHFRDHSWGVRPPRGLQETALLVERTVGDLTRDLGRPPTVPELAERTGLTVADVLEARDALNARRSLSLSSASADDEDDNQALEARLGRSDRGFGCAEARATVATLSRVLTTRERTVVRLRFEDDLTQAEIGRIVGLSQMHVSRVLRISLEKLRRAAGVS
jgi:RNA polymerase sigma-B factor